MRPQLQQTHTEWWEEGYARFFKNDSIFLEVFNNPTTWVLSFSLLFASVHIHAHAQLSDLDRDTNKYKRTIQIRFGKKSRKKGQAQ